MKIFFDGGCRPNPGQMEIAVVARGRLHHERQGLGAGSSHEAEWLALLHALTVSRMLSVSEVVLLGDSATVINQVNGLFRPRDERTSAFLARFREEALLFERVRVRHIRRTQNLAGIALAKMRERGAELKDQL